MNVPVCGHVSLSGCSCDVKAENQGCGDLSSQLWFSSVWLGKRGAGSRSPLSHRGWGGASRPGTGAWVGTRGPLPAALWIHFTPDWRFWAKFAL